MKEGIKPKLLPSNITWGIVFTRLSLFSIKVLINDSVASGSDAIKKNLEGLEMEEIGTKRCFCLITAFCF